MRRAITRRRRGVGLVEVITAIVIIGVISVSFTKLLVSQGRFFTSQHLSRTARANSRASMNVVLSDLRMVQDSGGVISATPTKIEVEVPYRYGIVCGVNNGATVVSLAPAENIAGSVQPWYSGYRVRSAPNGRFDARIEPNLLAGVLFQPYTDVTGTAAENFCTVTKGIRTIALNDVSGRVIELRHGAALTAAQAPTGAAVLLYQRVTYEFKATKAFAPKTTGAPVTQHGLFRTRGGDAEEEVMAPFETSARFRFFVMGSDTSHTTVPDLKDIRGLEVVLPGVGQNKTMDDRTIRAASSASVFFQNIRPPM